MFLDDSLALTPRRYSRRGLWHQLRQTSTSSSSRVWVEICPKRAGFDFGGHVKSKTWASLARVEILATASLFMDDFTERPSSCLNPWGRCAGSCKCFCPLVLTEYDSWVLLSLCWCGGGDAAMWVERHRTFYIVRAMQSVLIHQYV